MRFYDRATDSWYEAELDENGNLVEVAPQGETTNEQMAKDIEASIKRSNERVVQDATATSDYGRDLEEAAKLAMQEEQKKGGFQDEVTTGLMLATQTPENRKLIRDAGSRSTKQQFLTAEAILRGNASEMHSKDPELAAQYSKYADVLKQQANEITTKFQDKWIGTNYRYNTPVGSGREGVSTSSRFSGTNEIIRPELEGKSYEQAMNDTLETSFGKQTLGNRIDERKRFLKEHPVLTTVGGFFPIASQYNAMKEEGMNLEDLSATGATQLAGSALLQGGSYLMKPTGIGTALSIGVGTASDLLSHPERVNADGTLGNVLGETAASAIGGAIPGAAISRIAKRSAEKAARKASSGIAGAVQDDPVLLKRIEQNNAYINDLNSKLAENRLVIEGNPAAMQNAFVKAAGPGIDAEQAWTYHNGFMMSPDGKVVSEQLPWVKYAVRKENELGRQQTKTIDAVNKAKRKEGDMQLSLKSLEAQKPSRDKVDGLEKQLSELQNLYTEKIDYALTDLEKDIGFYKQALETVKTSPKANIRAEEISFRENKLAALEKELESLPKKATAKYAETARRVKVAKAKLTNVKKIAENSLEYDTKQLQKKVSDLQRKYDREWKNLGGDPKTAGFVTLKRQTTDAENEFARKNEKYLAETAKKRQDLEETKRQIAELEEQIQRNQREIEALNSSDTQESFKRGAEALLKKEAADKEARLSQELAKARDKDVLLNSSLEKSRMKQPIQADNPSLARSVLKRGLLGFGVNTGGDLSTNGLAYPGHEDYIAKNDKKMGSWLDQVLFDLGNYFGVSSTSKNRVNKFRGFKK